MRKSTPALSVEGKLANGKQVKYRIPFVRSSATYTPVNIKRNYLYRIILGDNSPLEPDSKLVFSIEDTPWNAVILNHHMPPIDVELVRTLENVGVKYDYVNHTLYVRYMDDYQFRLSTRFKNHTTYVVTPLNEDAKKLNYTLRTEEKYKDEQLEINSKNKNLGNDYSKRVALFEIYSDAAPEVKCILTIVYDKDYTNPDYKK